MNSYPFLSSITSCSTPYYNVDCCKYIENSSEEIINIIISTTVTLITPVPDQQHQLIINFHIILTVREM